METHRFFEFFRFSFTLAVAFGEAALGLLLVSVAETADLDEVAQAILRDGGLALIIAALLTCTFEFLTRRELTAHVKDDIDLVTAHMNTAIDRIRTEQFAQTLRLILSEPIAKEIDEHIIKRPFLRRNYSLHVAMIWHDRDRQLVKVSFFSRYEVENITSTPARYPLETFSYKYPDGSTIVSVTVDAAAGKRTYEGDSLARKTTYHDEEIRFIDEVPMLPRETMKVHTEIEMIRRSPDSEPWTLTAMTENLDLIVTHPEEIAFTAYALHPSRARFEALEDRPNFKRWLLPGGVLPYQGIELKWEPSS